MSTKDQQRRQLIARYLAKEPTWDVPETQPSVKVAAFPPPFPKNDGGSLPPGGGGGVTTKRDIPKDHPYDPRSLKPLAKSLWAASVAMGHALTAYRYLSRLKSATISPDGMLGGRGFVMNVVDIRKKLHEACESLSAITDTLHDEISAPHWKPRMAQLDENDAEDVERFVEESQGILENPEEDAEEEADKIEGENDGPGGKKPSLDAKPAEKSSELPSGGESAAGPADEKTTTTTTKKEASFRTGNSSITPGPGGPRIEHLDREDGDPNPQNAYPDDAWGLPSEKEYEYPSAWDNNLSERAAQSGVPDAGTDTTPTEAWDFGLGYGANGQGAGGYENPSGEGDGTKGVMGPQSGLPGAPAGSSGDIPETLGPAGERRMSQGELPGDSDRPVSRSDYYQGDRGNLVNTQSVLPGEATPGGELAPSLMNTDYTHEDLETPYVRYDYTTHDYRDDPLHNWPQSHQQE